MFGENLTKSNMRFLTLTLLCCILSVFSFAPAISQDSTFNPSKSNNVELRAPNIMLQSKDGGKTWQDISDGLPENEQPEGFFAGESEVYVRVKNVMYRSQN